MTTRPALDSSNLLRKFLWMSTIFLLVLNLLIASLMSYLLLWCSSDPRTFSTASFCWPVIFYLSFSMLLTSLHLLKVSLTLWFMFLKSCRRAFSLMAFSLVSKKQLSVTDLIVKVREASKPETSLHSLTSFAFSVRLCHLENIFFWPPWVMLMSWITALFFRVWPYSSSFLTAM